MATSVSAPLVSAYSSPLTKHLYYVDEVQAALMYCCKHNRVEEALFWCSELIVSNCLSEAIHSLTIYWLYNVGIANTNWLLEAHRISNMIENGENGERGESGEGEEGEESEVSVDDIMLLTYQLCVVSNTHKDYSIPIMLSIGSSADWKQPGCIRTWSTYSLDDVIENYFIHAVQQKKALEAWWAYRFIMQKEKMTCDGGDGSDGSDGSDCGYMCFKRIWEILSEYVLNNCNDIIRRVNYQNILHASRNLCNILSVNANEPNCYHIISHCIAILALCIPSDFEKMSSTRLVNKIPEHFVNKIHEWHEWNEEKDLRFGRECSIPISCLYGITTRGMIRNNINTENVLLNIRKTVNMFGKASSSLSSYWINVAIEDGVLLTREKDDGEIVASWAPAEDTVSEFMDKIFGLTGDIPDEWSKMDRSKSHGFGLLQTTEKISYLKLSRLWLGAAPTSRLAWDKYSLAKKVMEEFDKTNKEDGREDNAQSWVMQYGLFAICVMYFENDFILDGGGDGGDVDGSGNSYNLKQCDKKFSIILDS